MRYVEEFRTALLVPRPGVTIEPTPNSRIMVLYNTLSGHIEGDRANAFSQHITEAQVDFALRKSIDDFVSGLRKDPDGDIILKAIIREAKTDGVDVDEIKCGRTTAPFSRHMEGRMRILVRYGLTIKNASPFAPAGPDAAAASAAEG